MNQNRFSNLKPGLLAGVLCALLLIIACGGGGGGGGGTTTPTPTPNPDPSPAAFTRDDMLNNLADNVMLAGFSALNSGSVDLTTAVHTFAATPNAETLEAARTAWLALAVRWKYCESFAFGPMNDRRLDNQIDFWPVRENTINTVLAGSEPLTPGFMAELGVGGKGFPTMAWLLFDHSGGTNALTLLTEDESAARRREYLNALADDLAVNTEVIFNVWQPGSEDYAGAIAGASAGNETFTSFQSALSEIVNYMVFSLEFYRNTKLGKPMGLDTDNTPHPESVESPYSGQSLALLRANLNGLSHVYLGGEDDNAVGLYHYLVFLDQTDLANQISEQLTAALTALDQIQSPLQEAITTQPDAVQALYDAVNELVLSTKIDMAGAMAVTITFNDNDGD